MLDINCYCELVTNVVYDNFQDILVPMQCTREYKKFRVSPTFQLFSHANIKQQTSGHNNIPFLRECTYHVHVTSLTL